MDRTLEEVREEGLAALKERLGEYDMVRFLQQFEHGSGDYSRERREWVEKTSIEDIKRAVAKRREKEKS